MILFPNDDEEFKKAYKLICSLDDSEHNELIKHYVRKKDEQILQLRTQIQDYQAFFRYMSKFLPNKSNPQFPQ